VPYRGRCVYWHRLWTRLLKVKFKGILLRGKLGVFLLVESMQENITEILLIKLWRVRCKEKGSSLGFVRRSWSSQLCCPGKGWVEFMERSSTHVDFYASLRWFSISVCWMSYFFRLEILSCVTSLRALLYSMFARALLMDKEVATVADLIFICFHFGLQFLWSFSLRDLFNIRVPK